MVRELEKRYQLKLIKMITIILVAAGIAVFALFFKCIDWFEKI